MTRRIKYLLLWLLAAVAVPAVAMQDSLRFSLLTCEPGQEVYALFGHTALRCQRPDRGVDVVFNYGMFNFHTPNFVLRFVKGETDYQLGVMPYPYFESEYALRGSSVYEQELNLTASEKRRLLELLEDNYRPENRVYRYNYFYDNCTTRARDQVERAVEGRVVYPDSLVGKSYRSIVHEFTKGSPWDELGIDLCLGAEADREIGLRQQMFAPFYLYNYAEDAYIINKDGSRRPLVCRTAKIIEALPVAETATAFPLSPCACACVLLAVAFVVAACQWKTGRVYWGWEVLLMVLQGVAGCIIAFLFFVSEHPTVGSNWMLWLFNPVPLFYAPVMAYRYVKGKKDLYPLANVVYLMFFMIIVTFGCQDFNLSVVPLALTLLVTSASHELVVRKHP